MEPKQPSQAGGPQPAQVPQSPMASAAKQAAAQQLPVEEDLGPEALQPGKTGDNAKFLIGAIQNLHNYIGSLTDARVQGMVRNLIGVITRLVEHDQEYASTQLSEQMQAAGTQGAEGIPAGGGQPEPGMGMEGLQPQPSEQPMIGDGQIRVPAPPRLE